MNRAGSDGRLFVLVREVSPGKSDLSSEGTSPIMDVSSRPSFTRTSGWIVPYLKMTPHYDVLSKAAHSYPGGPRELCLEYVTEPGTGMIIPKHEADFESKTISLTGVQGIARICPA